MFAIALILFVYIACRAGRKLNSVAQAKRSKPLQNKANGKPIMRQLGAGFGLACRKVKAITSPAPAPATMTTTSQAPTVTPRLDATARFQIAWADASFANAAPTKLQHLMARMSKQHLHLRQVGKDWLVVDARPGHHPMAVSLTSVCSQNQISRLRRLIWDFEDQAVQPASVDMLKSMFDAPAAAGHH